MERGGHLPYDLPWRSEGRSGNCVASNEGARELNKEINLGMGGWVSQAPGDKNICVLVESFSIFHFL